MRCEGWTRHDCNLQAEPIDDDDNSFDEETLPTREPSDPLDSKIDE